jgi:hypothetical protein
MWRAKISASVFIAGAVGLASLALPASLMAQSRHWRSCLCCKDGRTPKERAAEAAALGVVGGAPALGFCGSVTGYGQGVLRVPYPNTTSEVSNSVGIPPAPPTPPAGTLPPPPSDAAPMPAPPQFAPQSP